MHKNIYIKKNKFTYTINYVFLCGNMAVLVIIPTCVGSKPFIIGLYVEDIAVKMASYYISNMLS